MALMENSDLTVAPCADAEHLRRRKLPRAEADRYDHRVAQRIYAADPINVFAHTSVWSRQRAFRKARAEQIAAVRHPQKSP